GASSGTATTSLTTSPVSTWRSRTHTTQWPSGEMTGSANRTRPRLSFVTGTGWALPGASSQSRWSAKLENTSLPARAAKQRPPYSWTRVRAEKGEGSRSSGVRVSAGGPNVIATSTWRPASEGRPSFQITRLPLMSMSESRTACSTSSGGVMGERQDPYGAVAGMAWDSRPVGAGLTWQYAAAATCGKRGSTG